MATPKTTKTYYQHETGFESEPEPRYFSIIAEREFEQGEEIPRGWHTSKRAAEESGADQLARSNRHINGR